MALWGGRFDGSPADEMQIFGESLSIDLQMWREDIAGSLAHSTMLSAVGLISEEECKEIHRGLSLVKKELEAGWVPAIENEDIHMAVEGRLHELIGAVAGKLHTARSRNDQVATDVRLWMRSRIHRLDQLLVSLLHTLCRRIAKDGKVLVPGYTHLQRGQPIWMGHQLLAHAWAFSRDIERLRSAYTRVNRSPLGAAAMAGTPHPIDRLHSAQLLEFDGLIENAMDAVAARDHLQEVAAAAAILASNLSRLSAELILWSSPEFSRIRLSDDWSTGSSIMPQKRNPDAAELIRGKTGRVFGALNSLLTLTKGLPMAYNRDLQEDRYAIFDALQTSCACVSVMQGCISSMDILAGPNLEGDPLLATEIADYLAAKNLPFREAHHVSGRIIKDCEKTNRRLNALSLKEYQGYNSLFEDDIFEWLQPEVAAERRNSRGGTAWSEVTRQIIQLKELFPEPQS
jgi:argininosuccinate lyase